MLCQATVRKGAGGAVGSLPLFTGKKSSTDGLILRCFVEMQCHSNYVSSMSQGTQEDEAVGGGEGGTEKIRDGFYSGRGCGGLP